MVSFACLPNERRYAQPFQRLSDGAAIILAAQTAIALRRVDRSRAFIDLGQEQPIESSQGRLEIHDRRHVPLRWLVGAAFANMLTLANYLSPIPG